MLIEIFNCLQTIPCDRYNIYIKVEKDDLWTALIFSFACLFKEQRLPMRQFKVMYLSYLCVMFS